MSCVSELLRKGGSIDNITENCNQRWVFPHYSSAVNILTTYFNIKISSFCPFGVFMCFARFSE